tara:strand:- start:198 stop:407 length:210 start_codon:yes stop_codon:yes gene_type:complete
MVLIKRRFIMPRLDPNLCIVCMRKSKKSQFDTINICSENCFEEYREVLNEMSEAMSDTTINSEGEYVEH